MELDVGQFIQDYGVIATLVLLGFIVQGLWITYLQRDLTSHLEDCAKLQEQAREDRKGLRIDIDEVKQHLSYIRGFYKGKENDNG